MCFLFAHEYADILKTILDVESFQYKEGILLFQEVVEPVVFLLSQNLWWIREVRSDCLKKCTNYVKVSVCMMGFSMKSSMWAVISHQELLSR